MPFALLPSGGIDMTQNLKLRLLSAAIVAAAVATPAWSADSAKKTTGAPTSAGANATAATSGMSPTDRMDPEFRARCFDATTQKWKTTSDCASASGGTSAATTIDPRTGTANSDASGALVTPGSPSGSSSSSSQPNPSASGTLSGKPATGSRPDSTNSTR
jgi:hypothetical protein